jgi:hypothetical protein
LKETFNSLQRNRKNQRERTQRRSSSTRPPDSHPSDDQHSKPEHDFHAVEDGIRFRAGPLAEARAVLGQELVGDDDEGFDALFCLLDLAAPGVMCHTR